ncbi:hypothetical protein GF342_01385 [Candidatus Woesearchaeota archaeon]|nr:hypothetical protein [Candidatus Woesearchaeota archaeon]
MKQGINVSITFIVTLIVTILLFAVVLYLFGVLGGGIEDIGREVDEKTRDQINYLINSERQLVAMPFNVKESELDSLVVFGLGIRNDGPLRPFNVKAIFDAAYDPDGNPRTTVNENHMNEHWASGANVFDAFEVEQNELRIVGLPFVAHSSIAPNRATPPGDYVFNVCVYPVGGPEPSCILDSISTEANLLYPAGKIFQATIRVPR